MKRYVSTVVMMIVLSASGLIVDIQAQVPAAGFEGTWQGTLDAGPAKLRIVLNISKSSDGIYLGNLQSLDQGGIRMPIDAITITGDAVHFEVKAVNGTYDGTMSADRTQLKGTWTQGGKLPLEFSRTAAPPAAAARSDSA